MVEFVRERLPEVRDLCLRYGVRQLQLFGSAYEGSFDPAKSDIDLIVVMDGTDAYFGLLDELERLFGRKVDLLEKAAIKNPYFIDAIRHRRETLHAA